MPSIFFLAEMQNCGRSSVFRFRFPVLLSLSVHHPQAMGHAAFQAIDNRAWETARTLGANPIRAFYTVMKEARFGLLAALFAAYGRIIAEVGASMMLGGNILHYTRNIPTANDRFMCL